MKIKRQKHVRRTLSFYRSHFGYKYPFVVLVDGTFCKAALKFQLNISEQMPKYFDAETRLCTTRCVLAECEAMGSLLYGPLKILKQYHVVDCEHDRPIPPSKCLARMMCKQDKKFIIATQDTELSEKVRRRPGVPLLFISHNAISIEAPSRVSQDVASGKDFSKSDLSSHEKTTLDTIKRDVLGEPEDKTPKRRKRKGPKGPNPLSCKKKKKKPVENQAKQGNIRKRNRHRKHRKQTTSNVEQTLSSNS